jgi:hypothetical protein
MISVEAVVVGRGGGAVRWAGGPGEGEGGLSFLLLLTMLPDFELWLIAIEVLVAVDIFG